MEKNTAIILAAGKGSRMQSKVKKQFIQIHGRPVIYYSLKVFDEHPQIEELILVTSAEDLQETEEMVREFGLKKKVRVVVGGAERYLSVYEGLKAVKEAEVVLVHDGARPMVDQRIISDSIASAKVYGSGVAGVPVKDTIKIVDRDGFAQQTPDRSCLWQIQTPQTFQYPLLKRAYDGLFQEGMEQIRAGITDDAMVVEKVLQKKVKIILGDYKNQKITTPEDLNMAQLYLAD